MIIDEKSIPDLSGFGKAFLMALSWCLIAFVLPLSIRNEKPKDVDKSESKAGVSK